MFVDRIGIIVHSDQWKRGSSFSDQSYKSHVLYEVNAYPILQSPYVYYHKFMND